MEPEHLLLLLIIGILAGLSSAFLGIGGGIFFVTLLPSIFVLTAQQTILLSLLIVLLVVSTNTFFFFKQKLVDFHLFLLIAPASIVGSFVFVYIGASFVPDFVLRLILLIVLILTVINPFQFLRIEKNIISGSVFGGLIGALAATVGVGMTILSPILYQSSWTRIDKISPTANAIMAFNAFFIVIFLFFKTPDFQWEVGLSAIGMIVPAAAISSILGRKWNRNKNLKRGWIFYIILLGLILKVTDELFNLRKFL